MSINCLFSKLYINLYNIEGTFNDCQNLVVYSNKRPIVDNNLQLEWYF